MTAATFFFALFLGAVHLFAGRLRFLEGIPRSRWLSAAGGVAVAYVFVQLLPELAELQEALRHADHAVAEAFEREIYLVALAGLAMFYGIERLVRRNRSEPDAASEAEHHDEIFWVHVVSFALYNGIVGYLLVHRDDKTWLSISAFVVAMALHFLVTDYGLRQDHKSTYRRLGRWILAAAVVAGWAVGMNTEISHVTLGLLFAFLAGGVVLNVMKEELPEQRESRFSAFFAGVVLYTAILLAV